MNTKKIGNLGEEYAENYLSSLNFHIIEKNYYSKFGEIDLIAVDRNSNELVFVEVKTRTSEEYGEPQDAVGRVKLQRMLKTALHFINTASKKPKLAWRFDVIAIKLNKSGLPKNINHIKDILDG